jgi:hypothetical protein
LPPTGDRFLETQKTAMPKETMSEHGIVRMTSVANEIPKTLFADEAFRKDRIHGTAIRRPAPKQLKHTITDQKYSAESAFDSSQLNRMDL